MDDSRHLPNEQALELAPRNQSSDAGVARFQYVDTVEVTPEESESHELLEYWQILRRRKGLFLFIVFVGALAGLLVTFPQTPIYQARTSIEITVPNESFLSFKDGTAADNFMDYQDSYLH